MLNFVLSPSLPSFLRVASTSFSSSLTAYSSVVLVSSTSSTINMFLPTRLDISSELRSSHCVRLTLVPGSSIGPSFPKFSYKESPMACIGILGEPSRFKKDLHLVRVGISCRLTIIDYRRIRAGTYPPPPMAIIRFGWNSLRIWGADAWQSLCTCSKLIIARRS